MAERTAISWADDTFNPWIGCTKVSPACDGCYAENLMGTSGTRLKRVPWGGPGLGVAQPQRTSKAYWRKPLQWEREQAAKVKHANDNGLVPPAPRFVFCASLADVFDNQVPAEWRRDLFALIRATPHLTWLLLTKRPGNIIHLFAQTLPADDRLAVADAIRDGHEFWPRNAALMCTVCNQREADTEIRKLLEAAAELRPAFTGISVEPMLGAISLKCIPWRSNRGFANALTGQTEFPEVAGRPHAAPPSAALDWVIAGGETDQGKHRARPAHPDWFRLLRDQCADAGIPFHFKQWGEFAPSPLGTELILVNVEPDGRAELSAGVHSLRQALMARMGKKVAGRLLDGVLHDSRPAPRCGEHPTNG